MTDRDSVEAYRQHLPATRDLIADKDRWTTGTLALADDVTSCNPWDPGARAWCLIGAFMRATGIKGLSDAGDVLTELLRARPSFVNDRRGHTAVLALLDRAIRAGRPS